MERGLADLSLEDGEQEALFIPVEVEAHSTVYSFCLVGWFLTATIVNLPAIRNTLPNIWHPLEGAQNSDLGEKRFLFKFFNEVDIHRVLTEALWTFNSHLLIAHMIQENEDPLSIPLVYSDWWVQIHDLPPGFFRESGKAFGLLKDFFKKGLGWRIGDGKSVSIWGDEWVPLRRWMPKEFFVSHCLCIRMRIP